MPQFIRSADGEFIINVSNVQQIYEVINPKMLNFIRGFLGNSLESGVYCEFVSNSRRLQSYPLVKLSDAKHLVKLHHSEAKAEQYIKALSCRHSHFELFRPLLDQVEQGLYDNMRIIDMYSLLEKALHWHVMRVIDSEKEVMANSVNTLHSKPEAFR
ncbi:MAG: hypothetical protein PHI31_16625 [Desulfuromonadaceae bacterium]|nr:hypothetical protein [Desulfuromonadaceae bacterium]